jgi:hypothetical protein
MVFGARSGETGTCPFCLRLGRCWLRDSSEVCLEPDRGSETPRRLKQWKWGLENPFCCDECEVEH